MPKAATPAQLLPDPIPCDKSFTFLSRLVLSNTLPGLAFVNAAFVAFEAGCTSALILATIVAKGLVGRDILSKFHSHIVYLF